MLLPLTNGERATRAQVAAAEIGRCMKMIRPVRGVLIRSGSGLSLSHEVGAPSLYEYDLPLLHEALCQVLRIEALMMREAVSLGRVQPMSSAGVALISGESHF